MRLKKRTRKSLRNGVVYVALILLLSGLAYGYKWINRYLQERLTTFELVQIEIQGTHILTRADVLELCGVKPGEKLLTVKPNEVVGKLLQSPYIKAASAVRSLPATLRITIVERRPLAFIYGRGLNLIDDEGYLLPVPRRPQRWNLPFISGVKERLGTLGRRTTAAQALQAVKVLSFINYMGPLLKEIVAEVDVARPDYLQLALIRGGARIKLDYENYQENLYVLSEYLNKYFDWQTLPEIKYMDVRFANQLIVKTKQAKRKA